jgi:hypothetical protein
MPVVCVCVCVCVCAGHGGDVVDACVVVWRGVAWRGVVTVTCHTHPCSACKRTHAHTRTRAHAPPPPVSPTCEAAGGRAHERHLHGAGVPLQQPRRRPAQLLVRDKLDRVKRQVAQQEGAVASVQAAQPLARHDGTHLIGAWSAQARARVCVWACARACLDAWRGRARGWRARGSGRHSPATHWRARHDSPPQLDLQTRASAAAA